MLEELSNEILAQAKSDFLVRERLFHKYRPKIRLIAMGICRRSLDWDNDDELSISLIAFNEAIETYDENKGMTFIGYAKMLIHRRLVDHFRKEARFQYEPLDVDDGENEFSKHEIGQAWEQYQTEEAVRDQREMIADYNTTLLQYGISIDDLLASSPKHQDTRQSLMKVAQVLIKQAQLMEQLTEIKKLPIKELILLTGISRKVIERGRKYVIALALVLTREEFLPIRELIRFPEQEG